MQIKDRVTAVVTTPAAAPTSATGMAL